MTPLTIAIPTWNRNQQLALTLTALLPQLRSGVELIVLDNCSAMPVQDTLPDELQRLAKIIRHPINIGACANVMRCFEVATGDWLWILGDDDLPSHDALTQVLAAIRMYPAAYFINFETTISRLGAGTRVGDVSCTSIQSLCHSMDSFSNFLFISAGVYRVKAIRPYLPVGYQHFSTYGPHVAMVLSKASTSTGEAAVFATGKICNWEPNQRGDGWDDRIVGPALQGLTKLVPTAQLRQRFSDQIRETHFGFEISDLRALDSSNAETTERFLQNHLPDIALRAAYQHQLLAFAFVLLTKTATLQWTPFRFALRTVRRFLSPILAFTSFTLRLSVSPFKRKTN